MDDSLLGLVGLAKKAGKLEVGDEPVSIAARGRKARLILMAADAAEGALRKGESLSTGSCPALTVPFTKAQLGGAVGRSSCALLALTDVGLAAAACKKLAAQDPDRYGKIAAKLDHKAQKTLRRRKEKRDTEKAERKPWVAPPKKS